MCIYNRNQKTLKTLLFKSIRQYDIIVALSVRVFTDTSGETLRKTRILVKFNSLLVFKKGTINGSSHLVVFLGKVVLKTCSKFTGGHICRSAISTKLQSNCIKIPLWHGCSPVLVHISRTPFPRNTSWQLLPYQQHELCLRGRIFDY